MKPITPTQAKAKQLFVMPDAVIESFNQLIVKHLSGKFATFKQSDVVSLISEKMKSSRDDVFKNRWLNVEEIYEKAGWKVVLDRPGWDESYETMFQFTQK